MDTQPASPRPATPLDPKDVLQKILETLQLKTKVELTRQDGTVLLHIATADPGRLIGRGGQTLNHLQYLVNRILQRADPEASKVVVDCERYRERERDDLLKKALETADKVRRWGEPETIGPYCAQDRRVIINYIARDPELEAVAEPGDDEARLKLTVRVKPPAP
jgi:spoIIIJ-associated protein